MTIDSTKKGKEIYEGDILTTGYSKMIVKYGEYEKYVSDGQNNLKEKFLGWYYEDNFGEVNSLFSTIFMEWKYEIIGNTYENQDLLK